MKPPTSYSWLLGLEGWWFHGHSGWLWPPSKFKVRCPQVPLIKLPGFRCQHCRHVDMMDTNWILQLVNSDNMIIVTFIDMNSVFLDKPVWNTCCFMLMDYPLGKPTVCCWTSHFLWVNQRTKWTIFNSYVSHYQRVPFWAFVKVGLSHQVLDFPSPGALQSPKILMVLTTIWLYNIAMENHHF